MPPVYCSTFFMIIIIVVPIPLQCQSKVAHVLQLLRVLKFSDELMDSLLLTTTKQHSKFVIKTVLHLTESYPNHTRTITQIIPIQ